MLHTKAIISEKSKRLTQKYHNFVFSFFSSDLPGDSLDGPDPKDGNHWAKLTNCIRSNSN